MKGRNIELVETEEVKETSTKKTVKAAKTEEKPAVSMGKDDFLAAVSGVSTAKEPAKTKKNGIQTINPPEEVKKAVDAVVQAKKAMKEAKATLETKEVEVLDYMQPIYEEDGFGSNFQKSYYIQGEKEKVTFVTSDKFSAPKNEEIPALMEAFGDKFEQFIKKDTNLIVRPEIFTDKVLQQKLMAAVKASGANFGDFFVAETRWFVADEFDRNRFSLPKTMFNKVMAILRQAKASLK